MSARTIAPDRRRLQEASRAGIRRSSVWLARGGLCLALGAALPRLGAALARLAALDLAAVDATAIGARLRDAGLVLVALLAIAAALRLLAAGVGGGLGPVDRTLARRFTAAEGRRGPALVGLALVLVGLSVALHRGVVAGAARGVDATAAGLEALWTGWGGAALMTAGGLLVAFGVLELLLDERDRRQALRLSREELRELQRERGAARR